MTKLLAMETAAHVPAADAQGPEAALDRVLRQIITGQFVLTDGQGALSKWSDPAEFLFDLPAEEALGQPFFGRLVPGSSLPRDVEAWRGFLEGGEDPGPQGLVTVDAARPGGGTFPLEAVFVPVKLDEGFDFSLFLEDLSFELPLDMMLLRMRQQHPVVIKALRAALSEEPPPWEGWRTAGTLVAFRALVETPWEVEARERREAERAAAEAELQERIQLYEAPEVQGSDVYDLEDARAVIDRLRWATERIEEFEERSRIMESAAQQAADARLRADAVDAERQQVLARLERVEVNLPTPEQLQRVAAEAAALEAQTTAEQLRTEFQATFEDVRRGTDEARERADELRGLIDDAREQADEARRQIDEARGQADEARGQADEARRVADETRARLEEELRDAPARRAAELTEAAESEIRGFIDSAREEFHQLRGAAEAARGEAETARGESRSAGEVVARLEAELAEARADAERARQETEELRDEVRSALAAIQDQRQGFEEARQAAVAARRDAEAAKLAAEKLGNVSVQTTEKFADMWKHMLAAAPSREGAAPAARPAGRALHVPKREAPPQRPPREGFDDQPRAMAVLDLKGRFTELNPAFSKLVGYREHEFAKATWPSVLDRGVFKAQAAELERLLAGELEVAEVQSTYMHSQGLMVPVSGEIRLVRGEDGEPVSLLLVAEDRQTA